MKRNNLKREMKREMKKMMTMMMMMMMKMTIGLIHKHLNGKLQSHLIGLDQEYIFMQILIFRNKK